GLRFRERGERVERQRLVVGRVRAEQARGGGTGARTPWPQVPAHHRRGTRRAAARPHGILGVLGFGRAFRFGRLAGGRRLGLRQRLGPVVRWVAVLRRGTAT